MTRHHAPYPIQHPHGRAGLVLLGLVGSVLLAACSTSPDIHTSSSSLPPVRSVTASPAPSTSQGPTTTPSPSTSRTTPPVDPGPKPVSSPPVTNPDARLCAGSALTLTGPLEGWGGISQEQEVTYQVNNRSARDCSLKGYPTIRFSGPGASTFRYRQGHSQGPFLSTKPPGRVVIAAHGWAYFQIVRATCEGAETGNVPRTLRITMPGKIVTFVERLKPGHGFPTCTAGSTDYGSIVSTSPIRLNGHDIIGF